MTNVARLWIVIPAYNEASTIARVVRSLREMGYSHVCVVDDGSQDCTASLAREAGAYVLRHLINLGQGAALQTGISFALQSGAEYLCTFDGDGQHSPEAIANLLTGLLRVHADVSLGSRFLGKTNAVPPFRRLLLKAALIFTKVHSHLTVTDTHNGLRLFSRHAAESITIEQPAMAHASEILQKIRSLGLRYVEVPVDVVYTEYSRKKGQSGFDSIKVLIDLLYRSIAQRP